MRQRQAVKGDNCYNCNSVPFTGETVYLTGLGSIRCATCQGDKEWQNNKN